MFSLSPPSLGELARVAAAQADCELTYAEHGATRGPMPAGYRHDQWDTDLGAFDEATFDRLGAAQGEEAFHVIRDGRCARPPRD